MNPSSHLADQLMSSLPAMSALPSELKTSTPTLTEIKVSLFNSKVESIRSTALALIVNSTEVQQSSEMEKTRALNPTLLVESIRSTALAMIVNSAKVQQSSQMEKTRALNPTLLVESIRSTALAMIVNSAKVQQSSQMEKTRALNPTLLPSLQYRPELSTSISTGIIVCIAVGLGFALLGVGVCIAVLFLLRRKYYHKSGCKVFSPGELT